MYKNSTNSTTIWKGNTSGYPVSFRYHCTICGKQIRFCIITQIPDSLMEAVHVGWSVYVGVSVDIVILARLSWPL